jgi:hypothetical protein
MKSPERERQQKQAQKERQQKQPRSMKEFGHVVRKKSRESGEMRRLFLRFVVAEEIFP